MIFFAVGFAMFLRDMLNTANIVLLGKEKVWLAGWADGLADLAALFCLGVTGAEMLKHGVWWGLEAGVGIVVGSQMGTQVGERWGKRLAC